MFFNAAFACLLGELNCRSKALCANVISNRDYATLDSIDTLLLKIYRDEADALYLKFDALLDSTPQEIDRMAERIPKEYLDNVDLDETVTVPGKHFTLAGAGELYAKLQQMNEAKGGVVHKDLFSMILSLLFRINQQSVPCTGQTA